MSTTFWPRFVPPPVPTIGSGRHERPTSQPEVADAHVVSASVSVFPRPRVVPVVPAEPADLVFPAPRCA